MSPSATVTDATEGVTVPLPPCDALPISTPLRRMEVVPPPSWYEAVTEMVTVPVPAPTICRPVDTATPGKLASATQPVICVGGLQPSACAPDLTTA